MSDLEKKAFINDEILEQIANVLQIPVNAIKNFCEDATINIIANTFNDVFNDNSSFVIRYQSYNNQNPDMIEQVLKAIHENNALLTKFLSVSK